MSRFFDVYEYECRDNCGFNTLSKDILDVSDTIRDWWGHPVYCNSGCRCPDHNVSVHGAPRSRHLPRLIDGEWCADAMDLSSRHEKKTFPTRCAAFIRTNFPTASYKVYDTYIHVDVRPGDPFRAD